MKWFLLLDMKVFFLFILCPYYLLTFFSVHGGRYTGSSKRHAFFFLSYDREIIPKGIPFNAETEQVYYLS
jgi:hypothetical protein